jgi:hypothetical protein
MLNFLPGPLLGLDRLPAAAAQYPALGAAAAGALPSSG